MKTFLSQCGCKKLIVILLFSLILTGAIEASEQNPCECCAAQRAMQASHLNEFSDSASSASSSNGMGEMSRPSPEELRTEYKASIEGKIIGIVTDMMAIFLILSSLVVFGQCMVFMSR